MKNIFVFLFFGVSSVSMAQVYVTDLSNQIFKLDPISCEVELQFEVRIGDTLQDLAIRSDGQLYGISNHGDLYQINPQIEEVLLIHSFLNLQIFQALYFGAEGQIYVCGSEGFLYSFEISTKSEQFLGDIGNSSVEDLIEYTGNLYASTSQQTLLHVNLSSPSQSDEVLDSRSISLAGLYTSENPASPCEALSMFGISESGKVYEIDIKLNEITEICDLGFEVSGATSSMDLIQSTPLIIQGITSLPSQCSADNGNVAIQAIGGIGRLLFSIDDAEYVPNSLLSNIAPGNYTINVRDENNCIVSQEIEIKVTSDPVIDSIELNLPTCPEGKGSVLIEAQGIASLEYSMDGIVYQTSNFFSDLAGGSYNIWVRDSNGCQATSKIYLIPKNTFKIQKIITKPAVCNSENGSISLSLSADDEDVTFKLDDYVQNTSLFENIPAGLHRLTVVQGMDCRIDTIIRVDNERCGIFVPNTFSPDHDGINDDFRIFTNKGNEVLVRSYQIFDRWGGKIYEAANFLIHEESHWWDGHVKDLRVAQGLYLYNIDITYKDGAEEHLQGEVSIF